ncbi:MAG TPA: BatA domain-containing protein, partial [Chiayiivirga sp.]|nr:BatA domain-containing protein [Chiayiivirga sp.]
MSLALLLPGALAALTALALPVLIHLARRDVHRRIDFAALRWLAPEARPRRRLRLEERALLAARLVLLALIALWLAQPALSGA